MDSFGSRDETVRVLLVVVDMAASRKEARETIAALPPAKRGVVADSNRALAKTWNKKIVY